MADMARKERSGTAKLDAASVRTIRQLRGVLTRKTLARAFDVSKATVDGVLSGRYWSHVS